MTYSVESDSIRVKVGMETSDDIERRNQRIRDGGLLDVIRTRTAMYTGERTLSAVCHFLDGYNFAQRVNQVPSSQQSCLPFDFHDWVAYRLHFRESTSGYRKMILKHFPDEGAALDRFFELFDEHRSRQGKVLATVRCHPSNPDVFRLEGGNWDAQVRLKVAEEVKLVVYTNDPGFFVTHEDQAAENPRRSFFCPALCWLGYPFKPEGEYLKILDQDQYTRLLQEDEEFVQRLKEDETKRKRQTFGQVESGAP